MGVGARTWVTSAAAAGGTEGFAAQKWIRGLGYLRGSCGLYWGGRGAKTDTGTWVTSEAATGCIEEVAVSTSVCEAWVTSEAATGCTGEVVVWKSVLGPGLPQRQLRAVLGRSWCKNGYGDLGYLRGSYGLY